MFKGNDQTPNPLNAPTLAEKDCFDSPENDSISVKQRFKNLGKRAVVAAASIYAGAFAMNTIGQTEVEVGPVTAEVGLKFDFENHEIGDSGMELPYPSLDGGTDIHASLFGGIEADTHDFGPTASIELVELDAESIQESFEASTDVGSQGGGMSLASMDAQAEIVASDVRYDIQELKDEKLQIAGRSLLAFGAGSLGAAWALSGSGRRKWIPSKKTAATATAATLAASGAALSVAPQFNQDEILDPTIYGPIAQLKPYADTLMKIGSEDSLRTAGGIYALTGLMQNELADREDRPEIDQRILLVSDIHNVPVYEMVSNVVDTYDIDAVIDSGDITDFGTKREVLFATDPDSLTLRSVKTGIEDLDVNYYFASGNHDSEQVSEAIDQLENAVATGPGEIQDVQIGGLRVTLAGDPFHNINKKSMSKYEVEQIDDSFNRKLREHLRQLAEEGEPANVVVAHEPSMLAGTGKYVDATINGHKHHAKHSFDKDTGTSHIQVGTTGGSGMRGARPNSEPEGKLPDYDKMSFTILGYNDPDPEKVGDSRLVSIKTFELNPFKDTVNVETHFVCDDPEAAAVLESCRADTVEAQADRD